MISGSTYTKPIGNTKDGKNSVIIIIFIIILVNFVVNMVIVELVINVVKYK